MALKHVADAKQLLFTRMHDVQEGTNDYYQVCGESRYGIPDGADLGGSSIYSNITSEDQGGTGSM